MQRIYPSRPFVGVGGVILRGDRVLLIRRGRPPRQGEWSIPGGVQRLGETVIQALRREMAEETALEVDPGVPGAGGLIDVIDYIDRDEDATVRHHYTLIDFWCDSHAGEARAGDDASELCWVEIGDIGDYHLWHQTERIILRAVALRRADTSQRRA
ncbi:MAG: NUDIX hydrolase [Alphaproteobacteria bacterium]